jgi:bifunctional DNase/RNase
LRDSVYFADLVLAKDDDEITVSSRPSDAIALAARMGAPLFATPQVMEDAGIEIRDEDEEAEIEKFREFLDDITPEDFEAGESPS